MTTVASRESVTTPPVALPEPRAARPIVGWAVAGVVFLIIEVIALAGWVGSGQATRTDPGPTPVPGWMKVALHGTEILGVVLVPLFFYIFLVRPWRREGHITTDGLLCLVFLTIFWQDSLLNYFQHWLVYNSEFWNLGAWYPHLPGWLAPNGNLMPEPLVWVIPVYIYGIFGLTVFGCMLLRKIKARWPGISNAGLVAACFGIFTVLDLIIDPIALRIGFYTYPGAIEALTLFRGHYYQFPVYTAPLVGLWWTGFVCVRYFQNDKGENLAERGLARLRVTGAKRSGVRFLALTGAINAAFLLYNIPGAILGLYAGPWPEDITKRSYFRNGLCGEGTTYACPSPAIPIPRQPDSAHVGPDGQLVVPAGTELPNR